MWVHENVNVYCTIYLQKELQPKEKKKPTNEQQHPRGEQAWYYDLMQNQNDINNVNASNQSTH